jgi:hypothetical protein
MCKVELRAAWCCGRRVDLAEVCWSVLRSVKKGLITTALNCDMATFVYRCPTTGMNVQGWFADDPSEHEGEVYETITCVACTRVHLINRSAGRVLGGDDE